MIPPQQVLATHWSYGRWIIAASLAHNAGNALYLPLVAALLGLAASGALKAVQNLALPLQQLLNALSLLAFPWMSRQAASHGAAHSRRASLGLVSAYVVVAIAYGAAIAGLGGSLLRLLYGAGPYADLGWAVLLVAAAGVMAAAAQALGLAVRAVGRPQGVLWSKMAAALFLLAAGTVLVRRNGLYGALVGVLLGQAAETAVLILSLRKAA